MKDNDKKTLALFIVLIILIIGVGIFNMYKNKALNNIDRKIEYIFNNLTYDNVYQEGTKLFFQTIDLINNKYVFTYEKDANGKVKLYSINEYNNYRKIQNFMLVSNTLKQNELEKYINLKKIIKHENNYYIETYQEEYNNKYVGSIIDIKNYDNDYVYFTSTNYYCENYKYLGLLEDEPNCNHTTTNSEFTIVLENNNLRINNLEDIINILK